MATATAHRVLTARDVMTRKVFSLRPDQTIPAAMELLTRKGISGAPVLEGRRVVGMFTEHDCLRVYASDHFADLFENPAGTVADHMTAEFHTVEPDASLHSIASRFLHARVRSLPVVQDGLLQGFVTRHDVLRGIQRQSTSHQPRSQYPDYRRPA
jgi:CBS domain-containing protein